MVKYCNECGAENKDESKFCKDCGSLIKSENSYIKSVNNAPKKHKSLSSKKLLILCVGVILIVAALSGYFLFVYDDATTYEFNDISFKAHNENIVLNSTLSKSYLGFNFYTGNDTGIRVLSLDNSLQGSIDSAYSSLSGYYKHPSEVYKNRTIYSHKATIGENKNDPRYSTIIDDKQNQVLIVISSSSKDETVFIADSVQIP